MNSLADGKVLFTHFFFIKYDLQLYQNTKFIPVDTILQITTPWSKYCSSIGYWMVNGDVRRKSGQALLYIFFFKEGGVCNLFSFDN